MLETVKHFLAAMWFCLVLIPTIAIGTIIFLAIPISMIEMFFSGFSNRTIGMDYFQIFSFIFLLTNLFFRRCYNMVEKLYPFSIFALCDMFIFGLSEKIMSYGYEVADPTRHFLTILAIIVQLTFCRVLMGLYFKRHPFN